VPLSLCRRQLRRKGDKFVKKKEEKKKEPIAPFIRLYFPSVVK